MLQRTSRRLIAAAMSAVVLTASLTAAALFAIRESGTAESAERMPVSIVVEAGADRADTLRAVESVAGMRVQVAWLPDGVELTGASVTLHPKPLDFKTTVLSARGSGRAFSLEQANKGIGLRRCEPGGWCSCRLHVRTG